MARWCRRLRLPLGVRFWGEATRNSDALGVRALGIEHISSTSVPGLVAKPIIDILLLVVDSADETSYVHTLETAGYVLPIREPECHEYRPFICSDTGRGEPGSAVCRRHKPRPTILERSIVWRR